MIPQPGELQAAARIALYQKFAEEALKFAFNAPTVEQRFHRLKIAHAWVELADQAGRQTKPPA